MGTPVSRKMFGLLRSNRSFGARAVTLAFAASIILGVSSLPALPALASDNCGTQSNSATSAHTTSTSEPCGTCGSEGANSSAVHSSSTSEQCFKLAIEKTADNSSVNGGDTIGFHITVTNNGQGTASDVTMTDNLPTDPGLSWTVADDGGATCTISSGTLTCTQATLGAGDSFTVHVTSPTTAETCGSVVKNTASVSGSKGQEDEQEGDEGGQTSSSVKSSSVKASDESDEGDLTATSPEASVTVNCAVLGINIAKSGPDVTHIGDTVHYTLTVTNGTLEPLQTIAVTDVVCDGPPAYQSGDTNADNILQSGETWIYTCDHVVTASDPDPLLNTAHVTGVDKLGRGTSAQASHSVDILHPSVSIVKTANPTTGAPGDTVTYTFVIKNTSSDTPLSNVTVTDDKLGLIGTIASLAPGQSVTLTKTTTLPNAAGDLTNIGTVSGTDVGGKTAKATASAKVTVVLAVKIAKTGTNDNGLGLAGFLFVAVGMAMATRKERGRVRPAFAPSTSAAGRAVMLAAHRRSWRMRRRRGPPARARLRWRRSQGPPMRDGP